MESKFEKTDNSKDQNKDKGSEALLFASAYSTKDTQLLKPLNDKLQVSASKYLPPISLVDDQKSAEQTNAANAIKSPSDLLNRGIQAGSERKGNDARAAAGTTGSTGTPGWNDFSGKAPARAEDNSLLGKALDFLKVDYSAGDNPGGGGAAALAALNDVAPARALNGDQGGSSDLVAPIPLTPVINKLTEDGDDSRTGGINQRKIQDNDSKVKEQQEQREREREREQRDRERKDQEQKERERQAEEQKNQERTESERRQREQDEQKKSDEAKKKDKDGKGLPDPNSDRPQLTAVELATARTQIRTQVGDSLTNPSRLGGDNKANAPIFGTVRNLDRNTNPQPNNDGNPSTGSGASGGDGSSIVPIRKVDVRGGVETRSCVRARRRSAGSSKQGNETCLFLRPHRLERARNNSEPFQLSS